MKKQITSLLLLTTLVAGCSDNFLSPKPQSSITTGNFYETPDEINQAVNGVYAGMHNWASNIYNMMSEVRSPNYMGVAHNAQRDWWDITTFTVKPQDDLIESVWGDLYQMINRANMVLASVDNVDFGTSTALRTQYTAEARFLRAMAYFQLVRLYGRVPLVTTVITPEEGIQIGQSEPADIYDFITSEMSAVVDSLPTSYTASDVGRLTKYAAEGLLAKVYLTQAGYPVNKTTALNQAEPLLQDVIAHEGAGYSLAPNYADLFTYKNDNKYDLFEIEYLSGGVGAGSSFPMDIAPADADVSVVPFRAQISANELALSDDLLNAYEPGDKRFDATIDTVYLSSVTDTSVTYGHTPFIDKFIDQGLNLSDFRDWPEDFPLLRFADVLLMDAEVRADLANAPTAEAVAEINRVRARAGLPAVNPGSKAEFDQILHHERRIEFVGEGQYWFDLVRWGNAVNVMNDWFAATAQDIHIDEHNLVYPIPQSQIDIFPGLYQQNPGY
jgi:hypothetical protein